MVKPAFGYVYAKEIKTDSGIVSSTSGTETKQYYEILAVGPGYMSDYGNFIEIDKNLVGKTVVVHKHAAEGDSPQAMLALGYALFPASRIMATEEAD